MNIPALTGLHHVTAITGNAPANHAFYTRILGLRLVKKTVNQDDVSAYHLFYADALGTPGTDLTFFDWPHIGPATGGVGTVSEIGLRLAGGAESLKWWQTWFAKNSVAQGSIESVGSLPTLSFTDPEGQKLRLIAESRTETETEERPWRGSPAPAPAAIRGLGTARLSVRRFEPTARILTDLLGFRQIEESVFETGAGGPRAQLRLEVLPDAPFGGHSGTGGVHHIAFRTPDPQTHQLWLQRLTDFGIGTSGIIDRFYFKALYFREPGGILFEISTDGPGFASDEDPEHLGEKLALPPFLESRRAQIEAGLVPLETGS
jgi:glyoxalase family protein